MSFLNNGNSRLAPKGPPNEDRNARQDRERTDSAFSSDLLQSVSETPEPLGTRAPAGSYADRAPSFASAAGSSLSGPTPADKCTNIIAAGAKWNGTLIVDDSVRVDGTFSGEIESKGTVHVAEGAQIDAKVRASYVVISGEFRGEIRCEQRTELMPRSRVSGEVYTKVLSVHEGATLDGAVKMSGGIDADSRRAASRLGRANEPESTPERRPERVGSAANGRGSQSEEV
ncbi:MAG TPA: polymer-forming cytoskeletal protein [Dehalococcoidia bacterium]|nr:polymer-forming cytoskeletal protein [Dehalococcoidia bacterium]